jgi:hypothetical protein
MRRDWEELQASRKCANGLHFVAGTFGCRRNSSTKRQALIRKTQNGKATNTHEM